MYLMSDVLQSLSSGGREATLQRFDSEFHDGEQLLALLSIFKTTSSQRRRNSQTGQRGGSFVSVLTCESQRRFDRLHYSESGQTRLKPTNQNAGKKV